MNKNGILLGFLGFVFGLGYSQIYQVYSPNLSLKKPQIKTVVKESFNFELIRNYNYFSLNLNNESRNIYIIESFNSNFIKDFYLNKINNINARVNYIPIFEMKDNQLIQNIFCFDNTPGLTMFNYIKDESINFKKYCNDSNVVIFNLKLKSMNIESKLPIIFIDSGDVVYNLKNPESSILNKVLNITKPKYSYTKPIYNQSNLSFFESKPKNYKSSTDFHFSFKVIIDYFKNYKYSSFNYGNSKYYSFNTQKNINYNNDIIKYNLENYHVKSNYQTNNYEVNFWKSIYKSNNNWYPLYKFTLKTEKIEQVNNLAESTIKVPALFNNKVIIIKNHQKPLKQEQTKSMTIKTYLPPRVIKVNLPKFVTDGIKNN